MVQCGKKGGNSVCYFIWRISRTGEEIDKSHQRNLKRGYSPLTPLTSILHVFSTADQWRSQYENVVLRNSGLCPKLVQRSGVKVPRWLMFIAMLWQPWRSKSFLLRASSMRDSIRSVLKNRSMFGLCIDFLGIWGHVKSYAPLIFSSFAGFIIKFTVCIISNGKVTWPGGLLYTGSCCQRR